MELLHDFLCALEHVEPKTPTFCTVWKHACRVPRPWMSMLDDGQELPWVQLEELCRARLATAHTRTISYMLLAGWKATRCTWKHLRRPAQPARAGQFLCFRLGARVSSPLCFSGCWDAALELRSWLFAAASQANEAVSSGTKSSLMSSESSVLQRAELAGLSEGGPLLIPILFLGGWEWASQFNYKQHPADPCRS